MSRAVQKKHYVGFIATMVLLAASIAYLYVTVLGGSVLARPKHVTVDLAETGGLYAGSGVTYRGVSVGKVSEVMLDGDHAVAHVRINPDSHVPSGGKAVVRGLSPAGEQYVDFQPTVATGRYLVDGDHLSAANTVTPTSVAQALKSIDTLMKQIDEKAFQTIITETHAAFRDPDDLGRVISASSDLIAVLDSVWPETERLLLNSRTVLRTGVATSKDFRDFAKSSRDVAKWLKDFDPTLRDILDDSPGQLKELSSFVDLLIKIVPPFLQDYVRLAEVIGRHDPHVRQLLAEFRPGFDALSATFKSGSMQTNAIVSTNPACSYGVLDTNPQLGIAQRRPFDHDLTCPRSFPLQQRGSAWRPGPTK